MTDLSKPVRRVSAALVHEQGRARRIVVILRPPDLIGFRASGCRREYTLTLKACYMMAVWAHVAAIRRARRVGRRTKSKTKHHRS